MGTNHVNQGDCAASRVSRDGVPSDILGVLGRIPKGTFHRARDGEAQGSDNEQEGCRKSGEGTHYFSWKGQEGQVEQRATMREREKICLLLEGYGQAGLDADARPLRLRDEI